MLTEPTNDIVQRSRYILFLAMLFGAVLMISNTAAVKIIEFGPFTVTGTIIVFPISYIFGDILTEVYGYKATRKIVWSGFALLVFMSFCYWLLTIIPPASFWQGQAAFASILGAVPRIVLGSVIAYFAGEFSNSYVMSKMKVWTSGQHLWTRTIGSTIVGEAVDTVLFTTIAFVGTLPNSAVISIIVSAYILKVAYEIVATPITYAVVGWLKRAEGIDVYDRGINYNPFSLQG